MKNLMSSVSAVALMVAYPAFAQSEQADQPDIPSDEEIVVTGALNQTLTDRLDIPEQDLPFAIDVIDREEIDRRNFDRFSDVLRTLPNVVATNRNPTDSFQTFSVRGFESTFVVNNRPENLFANPLDDSFIGSLELLRGPASVALGPTRPGGTVNTVLKTPQADDFAMLEVTAGNRDYLRLEGDLNVGSLLGDGVVSARISGAYQRNDFPQAGADGDLIAIRPIIEIRPSSRTTIQLSANYYESFEASTSRFPLTQNAEVPANVTPNTQIGPLGTIDDESKGVEAVIEHEFLDNLRLTARGQRQSIDNVIGGGSYVYFYNYNGVDPVNQTAYSYYGYIGDDKQDFTFLDAQLSGEIEVGGLEQGFTVGASYQDFENSGGFGGPGGFATIDFNDPSTFDFENPPLSLNDITPNAPGEFEVRSIYGEVALRPAEWLTIPLGVRYDEAQNFSDGVLEADLSNVSFRGGLSAAVTPDLNLYASVAESFISQSGLLSTGGFIEPETGISYELGLKYRSDMFDLNAAVFEITRDNVSEVDPANLPGQLFVINAGEQTSTGFEIGGTMRSGTGFQLNAGYGYADVETTDSTDATIIGLPVLRVPKHTATFTGLYEVQAGKLAGLEFGLGGQYQSRRPVFASQAEIISIPEVFLLDAFVTYPLNERFEIQGNITNLFDETYFQNGGFGSLSGGFTFGEPLTAKITARLRL